MSCGFNGLVFSKNKDPQKKKNFYFYKSASIANHFET